MRTSWAVLSRAYPWWTRYGPNYHQDPRVREYDAPYVDDYIATEDLEEDVQPELQPLFTVVGQTTGRGTR